MAPWLRRRFWRWSAAAVVAGLLCGVSTGARGAQRDATLEYDRRGGAERCPDERTVRDGVAARLGYDPFVDDANRTVRVRLQPNSDGTGYVARIELRDRQGKKAGTRRLRTANEDCTGLVRALVFTVSVVIDPAATGGGRTNRPGDARRAVMAAVLRVHDAMDRSDMVRSAVQDARESRSDDAGSSSTEMSRDRSRSAIDFRVALGGGLTAGTAPTPSPLFRAGAEIVGEQWAVRLGGRTEWPTRYDLDPGRLVTSLTAATLDVCGRIPPIFACGTAVTGRLQLSGAGLADENSVGRLYASAGVGGGVDVALGDRFAVRFQGQLMATLVRTRAFVGGDAVWATPGIAGTLSAALLVDF